MKGNNHDFKTFDDELLFPTKQYLWCYEFWLGFKGNTNNVFIFTK